LIPDPDAKTQKTDMSIVEREAKMKEIGLPIPKKSLD